MVELIKIDKEFDLETREKFIKQNNFLKENGVLIVTCNRVEFYYGDGEIPDDIVTHLFGLVSGIKSTIVGELAILNQVKEGYLKASEKFNLSKSLHKLFQHSFYVAKKVRSLTDISKGAMSYGHAVIEILKEQKKDFTLNNITIIGVNKINKTILDFLTNYKVNTIFLANRTFDKAKELADIYSCKAMRLDSLPDILNFTDILISSTSAPHIIAKKEDFSKDKKMLLFDLAVPRDIDPEVSKLDNKKLYNII